MTIAQPAVYLLDDEPATAETVRRVAGIMNLPCLVFTSGRELFNAFDGSQCGCLVSEFKISDVNGIQILQQLIEQGSTLPVIFVTAHATVPIAVRVMRAGAFHLLEKPCREEELWDAIEEALAIDEEQRRVAQQYTVIQSRIALLTRKEEEVLRKIGEGKPNRVIAEELDLSIRTVEVRRSAIVRKLEIQCPEELLRLAMALGNGHADWSREDRRRLRSGLASMRWAR